MNNPKKVKKTPEEKEFEKFLKLFTSSIFDMKHGFIYLDRDNPTRMICATFGPHEMYTRSRTIMDTIRIVDTKGIDLLPYWDAKLPLEKKGRMICLDYGGMRAMKTKCGDDFDAMRKLWKVDEFSGMTYIDKIEKHGKREKLVKRPILWKLSKSHFIDLAAMVQEVVDFVKKQDLQATVEVDNTMVNRTDIALIPLTGTCLGKGTRLPFCNGFDCTSLSGYAKISKLDKIKIHIGQDANIYRYYCTSDDQYAEVVAALPVGYRFPRV